MGLAVAAGIGAVGAIGGGLIAAGGAKSAAKTVYDFITFDHLT